MSSQINSILNIASNEVGYLEKNSNSNLDDKTTNAGSGNYTKYWRDLKPSWLGQPWCNCFVNWVFTLAFGNTEAKKILYSEDGWSYYTPTSAQYFKDNKAWYSTPKAGDIIYFKNSSRIHHVGIVRAISSDRVYTIEGNTSSGTAVVANGGGVFNKSYSLKNSNIAGYGRPKYTADVEISYTTDSISTGRAGLIVEANSLNIRKEPSTSASTVGSLAKGKAIYPEIKTTIDGKYWFQIDSGWVSGSYVTGWIKQFDKWWYLDNGVCPTFCLKEIDDEIYAFDKDGWLITSDRIDEDGVIS